MKTRHEYNQARFDESGDIYESGYFCSYYNLSDCFRIPSTADTGCYVLETMARLFFSAFIRIRSNVLFTTLAVKLKTKKDTRFRS